MTESLRGLNSFPAGDPPVVVALRENDAISDIYNETPFVVQWFVQQGIEVWSTREGEQRFDTHMDKLLNYIRFWQASGESEKTSKAYPIKQPPEAEDERMLHPQAAVSISSALYASYCS